MIPKSSGKCWSALRTGIGVRPPIAHREPRVIVAQSHRAKGLGAALAREIFQIAKEVGLRKVIARMPLRQEGARRMFERIGFHAEALLSDWVVDRNDRTHDLLVMSYDVTSLTAE